MELLEDQGELPARTYLEMALNSTAFVKMTNRNYQGVGLQMSWKRASPSVLNPLDDQSFPVSQEEYLLTECPFLFLRYSWSSATEGAID